MFRLCQMLELSGGGLLTSKSKFSQMSAYARDKFHYIAPYRLHDKIQDPWLGLVGNNNAREGDRWEKEGGRNFNVRWPIYLGRYCYEHSILPLQNSIGIL